MGIYEANFYRSIARTSIEQADHASESLTFVGRRGLGQNCEHSRCGTRHYSSCVECLKLSNGGKRSIWQIFEQLRVVFAALNEEFTMFEDLEWFKD